MFGDVEPLPNYREIGNQPKPTNQEQLYGQFLERDGTADNWRLATGNTGREIGVCRTTTFISLTTDNLNGTTTAKRGAATTAVKVFVTKGGRLETVAKGIIPAGGRVALATGDFPNGVIEATTGMAAIGEYVINVNQTNIEDGLVAAAANDKIKIDLYDTPIIV